MLNKNRTMRELSLEKQVNTPRGLKQRHACLIFNKKQIKIFLTGFIAVMLILLLSSLVLAVETAYGPEIRKEYYTLSRSKVEREITQGYLFKDNIKVTNHRTTELKTTISLSEDISKIIDLDSSEFLVSASNSSEIPFLIKGKFNGTFIGTISLKGDINEEIPMNITILEISLNPQLIVKIETLEKTSNPAKPLGVQLDVSKLKKDEIKNVSVKYDLTSPENKTISLGEESFDAVGSFQAYKRFALPANTPEGEYIIETTTEYENKVIQSSTPITLKMPFIYSKIFGIIPVWLVLIILSMILTGLLTYLFIKRSIEKKKKYRMSLDVKKIPKKDPSFLHLGKIAETTIQAYLEPLRMTTHTIVAGATGGGKSIAAQVIVEEALLKKIAVLVFDPTAQWSGMLRKCTDKKMMSFYPNFGLKPTDARGFPGNIRKINNAREVIDLKKFISPGQINIFVLNRLDPSEMDIFVASVVRQVFRSNPDESPDLKILLVFDEVHRLLAKFGGSGEGFLQIERACREFRKWGIGILLISQVLSDFVGEIKANINTEVQMRTRDEGDLKRIQTKYGDEFLQSLVKASVGVGMFVNAAYNNAAPYFINFRPILHNTRRLSDEELEKYNKYNDVVDDIEYQVEQLEAEKIDVFDLKMELKLVKDKIMTGNFAIVDIYLEGLKPRIDKQWEKIGKAPKKREIKLLDEAEIKKAIDEAKKTREAFQKANPQAAPAQQQEKKVSIQDKVLKSFTFENGIMVSSLKEMKDILPTLDNEIFSENVNKDKNDIAKWVGDNISKEEGEKLKDLTDKKDLAKAIEKIGKEEKKEENVEVKVEEKK
jgi:hypothetical protein